MRRPDAVLFDLDGTIVDSRLPFATSVNLALAAHGQPTREPEQLYRYLGPPAHTTFSELLGCDGPPVQAVIDTYRHEYSRIADAQTTVFDGVELALRNLHPRLRLAIATSKVITAAEQVLASMGLRDLFEVVLGPSPEAVNESKGVTIGRTLELLGHPERAVMVGDRSFDVEGAALHGIPTIGVLWGSGSEDELREAGAAALAPTPGDIARLLGF